MHVGHFIVLMIGKMLVGVVLKSFDGYFDIITPYLHLIQAPKKERVK
jgi:hypothetical protein